MWHRFLRQVAFWVGFATCGLIVALIYYNSGTVTLTFWRWELRDVNLGFVAVAPLVVGVALGYLYHLPARLHHVSEHMRHRRRVHDLERQLKDLQKGFDQVTEMPDDMHEAPALEARPVPALAAPKNGDGDQPIGDLDSAMELPEEPPAEERVQKAESPNRPEAKPKPAARRARSSNGKVAARRPRRASVAAELAQPAPAAAEPLS